MSTASVEAGKSFDVVAAKVVGSELTLDQWAKLPPALRTHLEHPNVVGVYTKPVRETVRESTFEFGTEGHDLAAGQAVVILVPGGAKLHLEDIMIGHRKREEFWPWDPALGSKKLGTYHDPHGANTEVQVFDPKTNQWRSWVDPLGHTPIKFAEPRKITEIEYEKLSCWHGMVGDLPLTAIRLVSRGHGDAKKSVVTEHSITLTSHAEITPKTKNITRTYTPDNRFADFTAPAHSPLSKPRYGGGKEGRPAQLVAHPGAYPKAVPLREPRGYEPFPLNQNPHPDVLDSQGRLHITLPPGMKLSSFEVSAGCKWTNLPVVPTSKPDIKFTIGVPGGHKLFAHLQNGGAVQDTLINKANVGSEGVIIGGLTNSDYVTKPGDEIVLSCPAGTVYIMGWRILYEEASATAGASSSGPETAQHHPAASPKEPSGSPFASIGTWVKKALGGQVTVTAHVGPPPSKTHSPSAAAPPHGGPAPAVVPKEGAVAGSTLIPTLTKTLTPLGKGGGTQGGEWHSDSTTGDRYFVKGYEQHPEAADRCATELIANAIYRAMKIPVATVYRYGKRIASKEIPGVHAYKQYNPAPAEFFSSSDIRDGFVVDALLANWDVIGLEYDNVLVGARGTMYRGDGGGTLFYRAMGAAKPSFANAEVGEIATMRNPAMAKQAGPIFKALVTDNDVRLQVKKIAATLTPPFITEIVTASGISNPQKIIQALNSRIAWLKQKYLS